eukprot:m.48181 g.48181  ORF g.48181 m.48181 type:complete len:458 (-) comp12706_c0_seq1:204-1577(-)
MWGGRFTTAPDAAMADLNSSLAVDRALWQEDLANSRAWATALSKVGLLTAHELTAIHGGLEKVAEFWLNPASPIAAMKDEDVHSANERMLREIIGDAANKVHTGRSRNDQVATDCRLWAMKTIKALKELLAQLIRVGLERSASEIDHLMPGYTHLQRAQPVRWSHWLLSHCWALSRDLHRADLVHASADACPLGSGAIAGNPFGVAREAVATDLGFSCITQNSMDAVSDRDFVLDFLAWANTTSLHLSRLAEDLCLYSTKEFGFVSLSDAYSTGSSLMPQKRNPDSMELVRSKCGRVLGNYTTLLVCMKGLPSTYNKDLQEDKRVLFDSAETMHQVLLVMKNALATLSIHPDRMRAALSTDMLATDLAYYLVRKGLPFRKAHEASGVCVKMAETAKVDLSALTLEQLKQASPLFEADVLQIFSFDSSVEQYTAEGGTSKSAVLQQIDRLQSFLADHA